MFIKYFSMVILIFLTCYSFFYTQRCGTTANNEVVNGAPIYQEPDNILFHICGIVIVVVIFVLMHHFEEKAKESVFGIYSHRMIWILQVLCGLIGAGSSFLILQGGVRTPTADQIQVYSAAMLFNEGNFINLTPGGYVSMYPQQLGYILFMQGVFALGGGNSFYVMQVINCLFIGGIVFFVSKCIYELTDDFAANVIGMLFISVSLPLFLLSSWVYGDIPSFFFLFSAVYMFLHVYKVKHTKRWLLGIILCMMIACLFRKNSLIFVIAMVILSGITFLKNRRLSILTAIFLLLLTSFGSGKVLMMQYERISGYEIDGGLPANMWIAMGMIEGESKPGWFNNYSVPTYYAVDCDRAMAAELAEQKIIEQIRNYVNNPIEAISFYKRKICTQWNDPYFNTNLLIPVDDENATGVTAFLLKNEDSIRILLSVLQLLIYMGALFYCVSLKRDSRVYEFLPLLAFLGGFLFSVLWEGNSRYVYVYVLMLLPAGSIGWKKCVRYGMNRFGSYKQREK